MKCPACPDPAKKPKHKPGDRVCFATRRGFELLAEGWRPFPQHHSLPPLLPHVKTASRVRYEGEPRDQQPLLATPEAQYWFRHWVDIIVELWAGPIAIGGEARLLQRDRTLFYVQTFFTSSMKARIRDARKEDLRSVREVLREFGAITGPIPELIEEVEGGTP